MPTPAYSRNPIRLGSRGSALALAQANMVARRLEDRWPGLQIEIAIIKTAADRAPNRPLKSIGDKALWVADLEQQLLSGDIDLAVHSMKDVPADLPDGLTIGAVPDRECPLDALVLPLGHPATDAARAERGSEIDPDDPGTCADLSGLLPPRARVGTSSDRRKSQLLFWRPDLDISAVRGNVDTRLRKLDEGQWDALVLAAAGLRRLGLGHRVSALIPPKLMVPAPGQGALGIEIRGDDPLLNDLLKPLIDRATAAAVAAERSFVRAVGGGCSVPLGVYTTQDAGCMGLWVRAASADGGSNQPSFLEIRHVSVWPMQAALDDPARAEELGREVADRFLREGGAALIESLKEPSLKDASHD